MNKWKRKAFRRTIDLADRVDVWFRENFNVNPKQAALEAVQDRKSMAKMEKTMGKHLKIKRK